MTTKWGVLSAGNISHDFVTAVRSMTEGKHEFIAVAARELKSAKDFAKLHNIPKAYDSYEQLAKDKDVEVVYIGTVNVFHLSTAKLMLENGKHVLLEKPLTLNTKQSEELFSLAKTRNLFVMEGIWTRFLPSYQFVINQIRDGVIGDVKHVTASLGINFPNWEHIASRELGGGSVLDLGVYPISLVQQIYNNEMPKQVKAIGALHTNGIDLGFNAILEYSDEKTAYISSHCRLRLPNDALIVGTKGIIRISSAEKVFINDTLYEFKLPSTVLPVKFGGSSGLRYQANEVRRCLKGGKQESCHLSQKDSLIIALIEDTVRQQIGVTFDVD